MIVYFGFIVLFSVLLSVFDIFVVAPHFGFDWWYLPLFVLISVVAVICIDGIFAFISRWFLPKKWFNGIYGIFSANKKECRFYEKLGIKRWKDKIPELGALTGFRKNKIIAPKNSEYILRYIMEANYGVIVHLSGMVFGFLIIFILPKFWYAIGLPVGIVNLCYNWLSFMILRYNLPKLHILYKYNLRNEVQFNKAA